MTKSVNKMFVRLITWPGFLVRLSGLFRYLVLSSDQLQHVYLERSTLMA